MIKKLLWLFLLLPFCAQAQISGRLLDSESLEPIPYAQITIANPKVQTYSTENGQFNFTQLDYDKNYTLSIDALGYFNKEINSLELNNNPDILLDLNEEVLPELYIIPENAKTKIRTYGQTKEGSLNTSASFCGMVNSGKVNYINSETQELDGTEMGILAKTKGLSKVLSTHIFIAENDYDEAIIKIQLYDATGGSPKSPIIHAPMVFKIINKQTGWFKLSLDDKNIFLDSDVKKIALVAILVHAEGEASGCISLSGILPSFKNMAFIKDFETGQFIKAPFSFPLYLTVETYSW